MNSRFKTEKTSICFRHYVATNLQQVCLPFCLLIASICDFFVQRITDHPVISTAFSQVSTVESFFSHAFRHTLLAISMWISPPLVSKKHHFQRVTASRKKKSDFSKKNTNEKKLQKNSDKCWDSRLYHSLEPCRNRRFPMERSPQLNIFHVAILTHWDHTGLVEHQHLVGEETWEAKFGDRNLIEIQ